jgi:hypothetical protein
MKNKVTYRIYKMIFQCKNKNHIRTIENYILQAYKQNIISQDEYNSFVDLLYDNYKKTINKIDKLHKYDTDN